MNLLVLGDHNHGDPDVYPALGEMLDRINEEHIGIDKIVTFNEDGVCWLSTVWAEEEDVPWVIHDAKGDQRKFGLPNTFLRNIVDAYSIDAFLFLFLEHPQAQTEFEKNVRHFYNRAEKAFRSKTVYTNKDIKKKLGLGLDKTKLDPISIVQQQNNKVADVIDEWTELEKFNEDNREWDAILKAEGFEEID